LVGESEQVDVAAVVLFWLAAVDDDR
jgi:hypothetical protein